MEIGDNGSEGNEILEEEGYEVNDDGERLEGDKLVETENDFVVNDAS